MQLYSRAGDAHASLLTTTAALFSCAFTVSFSILFRHSGMHFLHTQRNIRVR